ncbi:MAG TPA: metallophosphoesterase family protein [Caldilineae bacterium]|jgi:predicted phosphodiesterase|nr:metallophosphoesterase family protein [Caldilineae bacterium]
MRVLILSDIHANLAALEAVLDDAQELGFEETWCLGDIVGYGPDPNECIDRLRQLPGKLLAVAGNHDWAALGRLSIEDFNPEARRAVEWTREKLTPRHRVWLEELADQPIELGRYTITHGSPRYPIWEYILTPSIAQSNFEHFSTPYCLVGHTHVPIIYRLAEDQGSDRRCRALLPVQDRFIELKGAHRLILNPGSVGQPRDSDPRASYAILDTDQDLWLYRRLPYPIELTQAKMREAGLPERLIARLSYGW